MVLLSHDEHPDNLDNSGRALLADVPLTLTTPGGGQRLGKTAKGLADWESVDLDRPGGGTITVTGVPAIHGPGTREEVEPITGQVVGFVLTGEGLPTVYVSGDNASLDAVKEIAERFGPVDTAILFAGAPRFPVLFDGALIVLDSAQAAEAAGSSAPAGWFPSTTTAGPTSPRAATTWWPLSPPPAWPTAWTRTGRSAPQPEPPPRTETSCRGGISRSGSIASRNRSRSTSAGSSRTTTRSPKGDLAR